jgi:hypothetical protein
MARRRAGIVVVGIEGFESEQPPAGALRFADPSTAAFPRAIHTLNEPHSPRASGTNDGIRSLTGEYVPWRDRQTGDAWAEMNRKRRVGDEEK